MPPKPTSDKTKRDRTSIEDYALPTSIVTRITKSVLPPTSNLQKDAVHALNEGSTVFVNHLCAVANEQAALQNRKGINAKDVFKALELLEYGAFVPRLEAELDEFEKLETEKKSKKDVKSTPSGQKEGGKKDGADAPVTKKSKVDDAEAENRGSDNQSSEEEEDDAEEDIQAVEDDDRVVSEPEDEDVPKDTVELDVDEEDHGKSGQEDEAQDSGDDSD